MPIAQAGSDSVRPIAPEDVPAAAALAGSLRRYFSPADLAQIDSLLHIHPSGWVARDARGELIGFLLDDRTDDPRVREVAWMAVDEARRGQGIGTRLLDALVDQVRGEGVCALEVSTVAASAGYAPYEATRAFYHARGFVDLRTDSDYYWPGGDRLVLRRSIAQE